MKLHRKKRHKEENAEGKGLKIMDIVQDNSTIRMRERRMWNNNTKFKKIQIKNSAGLKSKKIYKKILLD